MGVVRAYNFKITDIKQSNAKIKGEEQFTQVSLSDNSLYIISLKSNIK